MYGRAARLAMNFFNTSRYVFIELTITAVGDFSASALSENLLKLILFVKDYQIFLNSQKA